jgi:uncharacterized protein YbgA (DUF1722 family)/uncharacterized protein YbbK (DUF523 family)
MEYDYPRPRVFCSECITFNSCRWNGAIISSNFVDALKKFVDFTTACPERDIGLGVPRESIRIVEINKELHLIQSKTGVDVSEKMLNFADEYLTRLPPLDGFILKGKSPSCGLAQVNLYRGVDQKGTADRTIGFFGKKVLEKWHGIPTTDEGRMENFRLREDFLTKIYLMARFHAIQHSPNKKALHEFQASHKLILMALNPNGMKELGGIAANNANLPFSEVIPSYYNKLRTLMIKSPPYNAHINVLMHAMGYFKDKLNTAEKQFYLESLDQYQRFQIPLSACIAIMKGWIARFQEEYLAQQFYFKPYPQELIPKITP